MLQTAEPKVETFEIEPESQVIALDPEMPMVELKVHQFIEVLEEFGLRRRPPAVTVCADFSGFAPGQQFPPAQPLAPINRVRFVSYYSGGARISTWDRYPGELFLEMVADGGVVADFPSTSKIELHVIAAGNDPIEIRSFDSRGALVGSDQTRSRNVIEKITLTGSDLTTVSMSRPELLIHKVCYQA